MALFFKKVLQEFGVAAFTLNLGEDGSGASHVTVVVPVEHDEQHQFYIFDPLMGVYFVDGMGDLATTADMLAKPVRSVQVPYQRDYVGESAWLLELKQSGMRGTENVRCRGNRCTGHQYTIELMLETWGPTLAQAGFDQQQEILPQLLRRGIISHDGGALGDTLCQQTIEALNAQDPA